MTTKQTHTLCPLCSSMHTQAFHEDKKRSYLRCDRCELVFVPCAYWLSYEDEKATYDLHENTVDDQGYLQFLARLSTPLLKRLPAQHNGLDFGCGPGPALSVVLQQQGHQVDLFDPFYYNDPAALTKVYDFICATEVVEHLRDPNKEFTALFSMLKPGGWLAIMTKLMIDPHAFRQWHYIRDPTHICFYSRNTFTYLAQRFNATLTFIGNDVILLNKTQP